jgi:hypothetical protein
MSADENLIGHHQEEAQQPGKRHGKEVRRLQKGYAAEASPAPAPPSPEPPAQSQAAATPEKVAVVAQAHKPTATKAVKVTFVLFEPDAKQVSLCGDFNGWAPGATAMKGHDDGHWEITVALAPGRYEYKFVVDGNWIPNPMAHEHVWNHHGTLNSVIKVRA